MTLRLPSFCPPVVPALLLLLGVFVSAAGRAETVAPDDAELARSLREEARELRSAADQRLASERARCLERFQVHACYEEARQQHLTQERQARERELAAGRIERELKRQEVTARLAEREAAAQQNTPEVQAENRAALREAAETRQAARAAKEEEKSRQAAAYREAAAQKQAAREQKAAERARKAEAKAAARARRAEKDSTPAKE